MEIYYKNIDGQLEQTTFKAILDSKLREAGFEMENLDYIVGVVQRSKRPSRVVVNIFFKEGTDKIEGLHVYETPIVEMEDDDNSRQIV